MEDTGMKEFKSISLMRRELRDWYVKAFREQYYNGNSKSEDADELTETELDADTICLSSKNGFESIKIKRQNALFFPYTIDDKCCRIYSKTEMKGEYEDLCLNGEEDYMEFTGWAYKLPVLSYICSHPRVFIYLFDEDNKVDIANGTIENRNTENSTTTSRVYVSILKTWPSYPTYFDEDECQGHSIVMNPGFHVGGDTAEMEKVTVIDMNSPIKFKSVSVPFSYTITVYD